MKLQVQNPSCHAQLQDGNGRSSFEATAEVLLDQAPEDATLRVSVRLDSAEGLPLAVEEDYYEDELQAGEPAEVFVSGDVAAPLSGGLVQVRVAMLQELEIDLGEHRIPGVASIIGQGSDLILAEGVVLRGWSVVVGSPDGQEDARIQLLGVIENTGDQGVADLAIAMELLDGPGGEIEACDEGGLVPGGSVALDASMYIRGALFKEGLRIRASVRVLRVLAQGVSEKVAVEME